MQAIVLVLLAASGSATVEEPVHISIDAEASGLRWKVENRSKKPVWAYLYLPYIRDGRYEYAKNLVWARPEGEAIVLSMAHTPVPPRRTAEPVPCGAVRLEPGATRTGLVPLGDDIVIGGPFDHRSERRKLGIVILEVGWLPVHRGQEVHFTHADDQERVALLYSEDEPGGQRFARSAPLRWK